MQEPHTGDKMLDLLKSNSGQAFTITQLSKQLGVSRVSTRKHAKKLSDYAPVPPTTPTGTDPAVDAEATTDPAPIQGDAVRMSKGPGKQTGTGIVIWYGAEQYDSIYQDGQPQTE